MWLENFKRSVRHKVPQPVLNNILLTFPFLYSTKFINYETTLENGISDLLAQLKMVVNLDGNILECGSTYCAASVIMAKYLLSNGINNKLIYACDSFEGFDRAELAKEREMDLVKAKDNTFTFTSYDYVKRKIKRLGFDNTIIPIKGFFNKTLPNLTGKFCFALVDCDLRDSIVYCMERTWRDLVSGGRIVVDDYTNENWRGAKLGVDFFVNRYSDEISEHGLLKRLYFVCKK